MLYQFYDKNTKQYFFKFLLIRLGLKHFQKKKFNLIAAKYLYYNNTLILII